MSKYAKYTKDSRPLWKPAQGESRVAVLTGDHEYEGRSGPVPVLDLSNDDDGEFAFMSSSASFLTSLAEVDPQAGDAIRITRGPDVANGDKTARSYEVERVGAWS